MRVERLLACCSVPVAAINSVQDQKLRLLADDSAMSSIQRKQSQGRGAVVHVPPLGQHTYRSPRVLKKIVALGRAQVACRTIPASSGPNRIPRAHLCSERERGSDEAGVVPQDRDGLGRGTKLLDHGLLIGVGSFAFATRTYMVSSVDVCLLGMKTWPSART